MRIDAKSVMRRINEELKMRTASADTLDGPVFQCLVSCLVAAVNDELEKVVEDLKAPMPKDRNVVLPDELRAKLERGLREAPRTPVIDVPDEHVEACTAWNKSVRAFLESETYESWADLRQEFQKLRHLKSPTFVPALQVHDEVFFYDRISEHQQRAQERMRDLVESCMRGASKLSVEPDPGPQWLKSNALQEGSVAWRCRNPSCPPRAPQSASTAPTCYTCGYSMGRA